jgi:hypothetical protein
MAGVCQRRAIAERKRKQIADDGPMHFGGWIAYQ